MAGSTAPRKRAPAKKATAKQVSAAKPPAEQAAPPAAPVRDERSVNEWLHDLQTTPRRIQVFDRWWEFKQPTGGRAETWDRLLATEGIRAALSSMMLDETRAPELRVAGEGGVETVIQSPPGSARADEFIAAANEWVPPDAAGEFWRRIEMAVFGAGEASAS